jgi:hypothetical protein
MPEGPLEWEWTNPEAEELDARIGRIMGESLRTLVRNSLPYMIRPGPVFSLDPFVEGKT